MLARLSLSFLVILSSVGNVYTARAEEAEEVLVKFGRIDSLHRGGKCGFGSYKFTEDNGSRLMVFTSIPNISKQKDGQESEAILHQATSKQMLARNAHEKIRVRLELVPSFVGEDSETGLMCYTIKKVEKADGIHY